MSKGEVCIDATAVLIIAVTIVAITSKILAFYADKDSKMFRLLESCKGNVECLQVIRGSKIE